MRENRMEIANSNDKLEIETDWEYLQHHAVPRLNEKIDLYEKLGNLDSLAIVISVIKLLL